MRTEKFNLCKSTKKLLTLITLLTLGVGQMWGANYTVYLYTGGFTNWENDNATFQIWDGSDNHNMTSLGNHWYSVSWSNSGKSYTGAYIKRCASNWGSEWNSFAASISSSANVWKVTNWSAGSTFTNYNITVSAGSNGSVSPSSVKAGSSIPSWTFTATPSTNFAFVNWTTSNNKATLNDANAATTYVTTASGACTVTANFAPQWNIMGSGTEMGNWGTYNQLPYKATNTFEGTITLAANTTYEFKVVDRRNNAWYGYGSNKGDLSFVGQTAESGALSTGTEDIRLMTAGAGTYTFTWNSNTKKLTVTYPTVEHPNSNYIYYKNTKSWSNVYAHLYGGTSTQWTGTKMSSFTFDGVTYYYAALGDNTSVTFNQGNSTNQDDLTSITGNKGKYYDPSSTSWKPFTLTITLNNKSATTAGTESVTATYKDNTNLTSNITCPEKTGYTFGGYYTTDGGSTQIITAAGAWVASVSGYTDASKNWIKNTSTTIFAKWTAKTYTVSFDQQSGSGGSSSVTATYGSAMPAATMPTRTGYTFGGYYTEEEGSGTQYYTAGGASARSWNIASATTLFAKWTAHTTTVTIKANGGAQDDQTVTATYGGSIGSFTKVTWSGKGLDGYYTASTGGVKVVDANGNLVANVAGYTDSDGHWILDESTLILHAQWLSNVSVTYYGNGNTGGSVPVDGNSYIPDGAHSATVLGNTGSLTRTGYTWSCWNTLASGLGVDYSAGASINPITSNVSLFAKWTGNNYTVTLNRQGGTTGSTSVTARFGSDMPSTTMPTKSGYDFQGYYASAGGVGTKYYNSDGSSAHVWDVANSTTSIHAHWTIHNYSITYSPSSAPSGCSYSVKPTNANYNTTVNMTITPDDDWHHVGVSVAKAGGGSVTVTQVGNVFSFTQPAANVTVTVTVTDLHTGVFMPNAHNEWHTSDPDYEFKKVMGSSPAAATISVDIDKADYSSNSYRFGGLNVYNSSNWWKNNGSSNTYMTSHNHTNWGFNTTTGDNKTFVDLPVSGTYTFTLTNYTNTGTQALSVTYPDKSFIEGNFAEAWDEDAYPLVEDGNIQSVTIPITSLNDVQFRLVLHGELWGTTTKIVKASNTQTLSEKQMSESGGTMTIGAYLAGDYTFSYNKSTHALTVTWPVINQLQIYSSTSATDPAVGNFNWDSKVGNVYSKTLTLRGGASYTFKVVKNSDFYGNGGTAERNSSTGSNTLTSLVSPGSDMTIVADHSGSYTFAYDASANSIAITYPTAYTISYGVGDVKGAASVSVSPSFTSGAYILPDTDVEFSKSSTNNGYQWEGWWSNSNGTGTKHHAADEDFTWSATRTANISVYACYSKITYTITYNLNGGTNHASNPANYNVETSTITLQTPTKTGYTFGGWYDNSSCTGVAVTQIAKGSYGNKQYWAKWTPITYSIHFNGNGSTSGSMDNQTGITYDAATNITTNAFVKTGYNFAGWALSSDGSVVRADGADHGNLASTQGATAQLWAVWTPKTCTVNFDFDSSDPGHGDHTSATTSTSATYDAAMTSVTPPTAATGYAFMGYFTGADGAGTQYYDGSGNSAKNWAVDTEVPTTLYAYYKKAEITGITFTGGNIVSPSTSTSVTAVIEPTPVAPTTVCWRVLYNNDNPLAEQPTFTPASGASVSFTSPEASGTYKLEAVLHTGSGCGGTELSTYVATFQVAGDHTVTILYQDANGNTIKASESMTANPLEYSDAFTAPDIFGYTFSHWNAYDGVKIKDKESEDLYDSREPTIQIKATYDGRLVAQYTQNAIIYFKNTLGWEDVYVNFYTASDWDSSDNGSGSQKGAGNKSVTNRNKHMTRIDDTDIWYFDYGAVSISPSLYVSFTSASQDNVDEFWASNPGIGVVYPANYADAISTDKSSENGFKAATPMFVPLNIDPVAINVGSGGRANYNNAGYWTKYTPGTGYTLEIYNSAGNSLLKSVEFTSEDELMPMKAVVDLEAGVNYKYQLRRGGTDNNGIYYGNSGTMTYANHGQNPAWAMTNSPSFSKCGITTNAAGDYTFNLSYSAYSNEYRLRMEVDYPIATGDYRVVYKDNVCTQSKASAIVQKVNNSKDTVSFFIRPGQTPVMKIQQSSVDGTTGAITWSNYSTITSSISSLSKDSVYNICLTMNESGAISVEKVEVYTGNYYIRTDAANSKWDNYRSDPDHLMTYSEYSINHGGYSHYYCHWVNKDDAGRKNVKFCIANDYSPSISDTLIRETASGIWANINNYIESNGDLKRNANVRFMWNRHDNTISRAYVDGAQDDLHAFLELISSDSKIRNAETEVIMSEVTFTDKENWLYEANIQAQPNAQIKLKSTWGESNVIEQYFKGSSSETDALIGGSGENWYDIRILYDFKTNRLVASYVPSEGEISGKIEINADIMFIREHQGDIAQLTFSNTGSIAAIKTAYGALRLNKWVLNNKERTGAHNPLEEPKSIYERSLYWISFPFRVKLSEVFGFGTYGSHWAIQYYDGADRAARGHFLENGTFWKWLNRSTAYLEPNQGYLLAIDLDLLGETSDVWGPESRSEQIELYFPSTGTMPNLTNADVVQTIPEHPCTINRAASEGLPDTGDPRTSYNRTIFDSHWNVMSVPTYVNTDDVTFANTDWTTEGPGKRGPNFLYTWNSDDNTITATAARGYTYHAMHSYMVQYCNTVTWAAKSGSPYTIVARKTYEEAPREIEFRLEIQQNEKMIDRTYVVLSNDEEVSANFAFGEDMVKEFNARKAAIFNYTADNVGVAGNTMPMSEQTTVIPVGLEIPTAGEYTFAIPDGTEGVGVILVDNVANTRTNLSALDYTVNLTTGTHDGRFVLEISPIHNATTGIEAVSDEGLEITGARKMIIDQKLYIVKDGKLFDATGKRVE